MKKQIKELGKEIQKNEGYAIIVRNFNFVTNSKLDKRGGSKQQDYMLQRTKKLGERVLYQQYMEVSTRRNNNHNVVQWCKRGEKTSNMHYNWQTSSRHQNPNQTTEIEISHTIVSDHDAILWSFETEIKQNNVILDEYCQQTVRKLYKEEREPRIGGYERLKVKCVENTHKIKETKIHQTKKN